MVGEPTRMTGTDADPWRVAGCDLGKASAKFVLGHLGPDGGLEIDSTEIVEHDGQAMRPFGDWYRRADVASCAAVGATGLHADELVAPSSPARPKTPACRARSGTRRSCRGL